MLGVGGCGLCGEGFHCVTNSTLRPPPAFQALNTINQHSVPESAENIRQNDRPAITNCEVVVKSNYNSDKTLYNS